MRFNLYSNFVFLISMCVGALEGQGRPVSSKRMDSENSKYSWPAPSEVILNVIPHSNICNY